MVSDVYMRVWLIWVWIRYDQDLVSIRLKYVACALRPSVKPVCVCIHWCAWHLAQAVTKPSAGQQTQQLLHYWTARWAPLSLQPLFSHPLSPLSSLSLSLCHQWGFAQRGLHIWCTDGCWLPSRLPWELRDDWWRCPRLDSGTLAAGGCGTWFNRPGVGVGMGERVTVGGRSGWGCGGVCGGGSHEVPCSWGHGTPTATDWLALPCLTLSDKPSMPNSESVMQNIPVFRPFNLMTISLFVCISTRLNISCRTCRNVTSYKFMVQFVNGEFVCWFHEKLRR